MNILKRHIKKYSLIVVLGLLTAGGNTVIVLTINKIISNYVARKEISNTASLLYFAGALVLFFACRWLLAVRIITFMQAILRTIKLDIVQTVLKSSFHPLVKNKQRVYTALTRDTGNIVSASVSSVDLFTNLIVILFCCINMGIISWKLLLCTLFLLAFTLIIYVLSEKKARTYFNAAMSHDDKFVRYLNEVLNGFKEIIISRKKGIRILEDKMTGPLDEGMRLQRKALLYFLNNRITGQFAFYIFIGLILFLFGKWLNIEPQVIVSFIFLLLYIWGPTETVVLLIPSFSQARISWTRLQNLAAELQEEGLEIYNNEALPGFEKIQLSNIFYQYQKEEDEKTFSVGPVHFSLAKGDVVFINGGNGSGKTTFVNLLMGLFLLEKGDIYIDNEPYKGPIHVYRSLFSPVFSDFHLFDELYGIEHIDVEKIAEYLSLFELEKKVTFSNNRFNTISLSAGQRKRLALITALMEKKPILILDEFAAEQDPAFRRKFYTEILYRLKCEGFTIIAITHDEAYYSYCDKLYHMDFGKLTWVSREPSALDAEADLLSL